ncbi:N-6 DNA methylase [Streptomyces aureus]|uniref:N-6 DNA methylase n=1 Tax=Streptomyces aureus TaxID=193461 RepID=UPI0006E23E2D|nr:N-6 DNA methylase [Streptomyces aureus]
MRKPDDTLVTRSRIAELAGVNRPAVTNWAGRYPDFPQAVDSMATGTGRADLFLAEDVGAWLRKRRIPAPALREGELPGTTYGDRFLAALGREHGPTPLTVVRRLLEARDDLQRADHLDVLLALVYIFGTRAGADDRRYRDHVTQSWGRLRYALVDDGVWSPGRLDERGGFPDTDRFDSVLRHSATALAEAEWDPESAAEALDRLVELRMDVDARGGEIITPPALRHLMAGLLPTFGPAFDPYCRTGELLDACVSAGREVAADTRTEAGPAGLGAHGICGDENSAHLVRMRLRVRGVEPELDGWRARPAPDRPPHAMGRYTRVATNPPFNLRAGERGWDPDAFRYGTPPAANGNFAWLQLALAALAEEGRAAVLMPDIAAQSTNAAEQAIRSRMVHDGAVEALIALPAQLFGRATGVRATLWLLRPPTGRGDEVLFVDAESLGSMTNRARRELSAGDVGTLIDTCSRWRGAREAGEPFHGRRGFSVSVPVAEIALRDHVLTPALYVPQEESAVLGGSGRAEVERLIAELAVREEAARAADERAARVLGEWQGKR